MIVLRCEVSEGRQERESACATCSTARPGGRDRGETCTSPRALRPYPLQIYPLLAPLSQRRASTPEGPGDTRRQKKPCETVGRGFSGLQRRFSTPADPGDRWGSWGSQRARCSLPARLSHYPPLQKQKSFSRFNFTSSIWFSSQVQRDASRRVLASETLAGIAPGDVPQRSPRSPNRCQGGNILHTHRRVAHV